jgi:cell division protein FtsW
MSGLGRVKRTDTTREVVARRHRPDYLIILYMGLLMMLGLIIMYAIGPQRANVLNIAYGTDYYNSTYFFVKQLLSVMLALGAFVALATTPYHFLQKYAGKILLAGFIACILLFLAGNILHIAAIAQCSLGACRWFELGPLGSIQPAELLKFGVLIYIAGFLGMRIQQGKINDIEHTLVPIGILAFAAIFFIIFIQKDMGTGISLLAILGSMIMVGGMSRKIGMMVLGVAVALGILLIIIAPHRVARIATFLAGDSTSSLTDDANYHVNHAKIAIGSGGLLGVGIGNSVQATGYLPEAINDSVFAIMGETFGFIGLSVILFLFTALLMRLLRISDHLPNIWMKLTVAGIFGWLGSHVILNVAAMTGVFPLTGITLPLLSFGGTSMILIAGILGLAFQLSRYTTHGIIKEDSYENLSSGRGLGRARYTSRRSSSRA